MRFDYYERLSVKDQATYRKSDEVREVPLRDPESIQPLALALKAALIVGELAGVEAASQALCDGLTVMCEVEPVRVEVLAVRPKFTEGGELHGLYHWGEEQEGPPVIQVWMRTAAKGRVVAFKTFLRTLLHEVLHHLDLALLGLGESFHTQGFFARESSLFHQLVPRAIESD